MAQGFWQKLNANERLVATGAIVVVAAWLVAIALGGGFGASWSFLAAIAVFVIYWLEHAPDRRVAWPAPVPLIVLVVTAIAALLAVVGLLGVLSLFGAFVGFFVGFLVSVVVNAIGSVMMALGAWREYQAMPKAPPPASPPPPPAA